MLTIRVGGTEHYDETSSEFIVEGGRILNLEHSLLSLSKWESIFEKPFLDKGKKSPEELLTYIRCMCVDPDIAPEVFQELSDDNIEAVDKYLNAKRTATWFSDQSPKPRSSEIITSELVYYWMTMFNIPFTCETWHLNRLFTLIQVCNAKQGKPKKMSRAELAARNRELNAKRKAELGTSG